MQIYTQMFSVQPQTAFKGTVDTAVIQKIKGIEKSTIARHIDIANGKKIAVNPELIEGIKARFEKAIETLNQKAKLLLKDSVVTLREDTGQIYVDNKKLSHTYVNILNRNTSGYQYEGDFSKFTNELWEKLKQGDPIVKADNNNYLYHGLGCGIYDGKDIKYGLPKTIDELECMVDFFNPKRLNKVMISKEKEKIQDLVKHQKLDTVNSKIKKQVKQVYNVEKELPVAERNTGFWPNVKKQIAENAKQANLEAENAKYLQ